MLHIHHFTQQFEQNVNMMVNYHMELLQSVPWQLTQLLRIVTLISFGFPVKVLHGKKKDNIQFIVPQDRKHFVVC